MFVYQARHIIAAVIMKPAVLGFLCFVLYRFETRKDLTLPACLPAHPPRPAPGAPPRRAPLARPQLHKRLAVQESTVSRMQSLLRGRSARMLSGGGKAPTHGRALSSAGPGTPSSMQTSDTQLHSDLGHPAPPHNQN